MVKKGNAKAKVDIDKLTPKDWEHVNNPPGIFKNGNLMGICV
jgi:hypothetical protein